MAPVQPCMHSWHPASQTQHKLLASGWLSIPYARMFSSLTIACIAHKAYSCILDTYSCCSHVKSPALGSRSSEQTH